MRIRSTIQSLIKSDSMQEKLSSSGYVEVDDRYCIMVKNTYKKGVGVVHRSSNSGRTLYVEPFEVVEMSNEYREV
jgi:dsDNA-specific endonuclease/ATPase MutS2